MTAAQLVPLILYYIFRTVIRLSSGDGEGKKEGAAPMLAVAIGAFLLYLISEYLVLWFSRTREYHADRFAGEAVGNPNALGWALAKIAYGLAGREKKSDDAEAEERSATLDAIGALGIFDGNAARSFALAALPHAREIEQTEAGIDAARLASAMRWDRWNPWALYYEIHSTHPLVAHRLHYLGNQAAAMGLEPLIRFHETKPESYWDEFLVDVLILWLPTLSFAAVGAMALASGQSWLWGVAAVAAGVALWVKLRHAYPSTVFPNMSVVALLKKVKVSGIRGVPCRIKGRVIGRGVPGLIWSEDFVVRDETGILFLDYRQPLRIWEFLFGLMRREKLKDQNVDATGWCRRSPIPYVELNTLQAGDRTRKCWVLPLKRDFAGLLVIGGFGLSLALGPGVEGGIVITILLLCLGGLMLTRWASS
jgi:hypothetical protein